MFLTCS